MKKSLKKNQIVITGLVVMVAFAGYFGMRNGQNCRLLLLPRKLTPLRIFPMKILYWMREMLTQ